MPRILGAVLVSLGLAWRSGVHAQTAQGQPAGRWITTWGAIAQSPITGEAGTTVGRFSEAEARKEALEQCGKRADETLDELDTSLQECRRRLATLPEAGQAAYYMTRPGAYEDINIEMADAIAALRARVDDPDEQVRYLVSVALRNLAR